MADAIVNDYGDEIAIPMGEDLTGWTVLIVQITKPDGTLLSKTSASNGVTDKGAPTARTIYYTIEAGVTTVDGDYKFEGQFVTPTRLVTSTTPIIYSVKRINQTVE